MAQNVTIAGASYADVPAVNLPKTGGGTAPFFDVSDTTATAADVASSKFFHDITGALIQGTASGGSTGLDYEAGTYTPASDNAGPSISFSGNHTGVPILVMIADSTDTTATANSNLFWGIFNWYTLIGQGLTASSSATHYGRVQYAYKTSSNITVNGVNCTERTGAGGAATVNTQLLYNVNSNRFNPGTGSTSRYWRSGRTYEWIAVWKPES